MEIILFLLISFICMICDTYEKDENYKKYVDNIKKNNE